MREISFDTDKCSVTIDGQTSELTDIEYLLMLKLVDGKGYIVHTNDLIRAAYGYEMGATRKALRQRMCSLRKKVGGGVIHSVYGYGYRVDG